MPGYVELEVSLQLVEPRIWRRFQLVDVASFLDLHEAVQSACGWEDAHLFAFRGPGGAEVAGVPGDDGWGAPAPDAATVPVASFFIQQRLCVYEYDFGDSWLHDVRLERAVRLPQRFQRRLLDGAAAPATAGAPVGGLVGGLGDGVADPAGPQPGAVGPRAVGLVGQDIAGTHPRPPPAGAGHADVQHRGELGWCR